MKIRQIVATMFALLEDNLKEHNIPYSKDEVGNITSIFIETSHYCTQDGELYSKVTPVCESGRIIYYVGEEVSDWQPEFEITAEQFGPVGKKMMSFTKIDK